MKIAPLYHALQRESWANPLIVHTDQHYDEKMSAAIFSDLNLPSPHFSLGVGSASHGEQTGRVMIAYEKICLTETPELIVVVGDVNSMLGATLVGVKLLVPVAHLEAGLRSFDRTMPEEINRIAADAIADVLWTPSPDADQNLQNEGVSISRVERVGNIMIDSFEMLKPQIIARRKHAEHGLADHSYGLVTVHRPSNVDTPERLRELTKLLRKLSFQVPLACPLHPRTIKNLKAFGLWDSLRLCENITLLDPLPYLDFMSLLTQCKFVLTDSGGLQEESTYLGIPCLTLRENTERPITVTIGTNTLTSFRRAEELVAEILRGNRKRGRVPDLWDGRTASRIVQSIQNRFGLR